MLSPGSVTIWIEQYQAGDHEAAQKLWEHFYTRLVQLARDWLRGMRTGAANEEDVVQKAFLSFHRGVEKGRFPQLADRDGLWKLLVVITLRKAIDLRHHETCATSGSGKVRSESDLKDPGDDGGPLAQVRDTEPTPELAAQVADEVEHLLAQLPDSQLRAIALDKLEGYTNAEIAVRQQCAEVTVERRLRRIREKLE